MMHILVILLVPMLIAAVVSVLVGLVETRFAIFCWFVGYLVLAAFGPFAYGWAMMPEVREDWTEACSLAAMILLQRSLEWWGLKLGFLFKTLWQETQH
jgi:hypothetical protein